MRILTSTIVPGQNAREKGVRRKLNAMEEQFKDKTVLLVDDSIVRGTTCREIVSMAKEAGARKVFFASCAPPITNAHIYGIDLASSSEFIAHHRDPDDIAKEIGAARVIFQDLDDLKAACVEAVVPTATPRPDQDFEVGVFCGKYVTPVDDAYFVHLEQIRGETRKAKVMENAREAVVNGSAGREEFEIASNGVHVNHDGKVVPAKRSRQNSLVNGNSSSRIKGEDGATTQWSEAEETEPRDRQDISLHNLNDERPA